MTAATAGIGAELLGRTVVVVGGTSGIGLATAQLAARVGARVCIIGRDATRLSQIREQQPQWTILQADLRSDAEVTAAFAQLVTVDHLFISAGTVAATPVLESDFEALRAPFEERVFGVLRVVRAAAPKMTSGSITFTSGDLVDRPVAGLSAVVAAASATEALARTLALELAPIRFNTISPGSIDTPLHDKLFGRERDAALAAQAARLPGKRVGRPEEVAQLALTIMSVDYINAGVFSIDGGLRYA